MEQQEIIIKTPDFKNIVDILEHFNLQYERSEFLDYKTIPPLELEDWFLDDLKFSFSKVGTDDKEAFMCEFVIVPFLKKVWKLHRKLNLFSHVQLKTEDFTIVPDYLVTGANKRGFKFVEKPLLVTVEAKYEKFNEGWFQAAMQMVAARQMNKNNAIPVYSVVTTGELWQFGKLENSIIYQHPISVSVQNPQQIAGVLSYIFGECEKNAALLA